jgi:hypothetical protein
MRLIDFVPLISSMPEANQAFASKRSTWSPYIRREDAAGAALRSIFGSSNSVFLSRSDLRLLASKPDLAEFVIATILWGYPGGMRGNHFASLIDHLSRLIQTLDVTRSRPISDWASHYEQVKAIEGVGLSTYTKFLHFLSIHIENHLAVILDKRIIDVMRNKVFEELAPLSGLSYENASRHYPTYLECLASLAQQLSVPPTNIEFFLFEFGLHLKLA